MRARKKRETNRQEKEEEKNIVRVVKLSCRSRSTAVVAAVAAGVGDRQMVQLLASLPHLEDSILLTPCV